MINRQELHEHAKVFDHYYGTPRKPVEAALAGGRDVLFDIDWQGTQQMRDSARDDLVSIFILPPSTARAGAAPEDSRAQDSPAVVAKRMSEGRRRDEPLAGIRLHRS
jgi:guanylate kinase